MSKLIQTIVSIMKKFNIVDVNISLNLRLFYGDLKREIPEKLEEAWQVFSNMKNFFIKSELNLNLWIQYV